MPLEIRDPVHDLVARTPLECRVMNTQAMQRLRRIKQLALANLVYPGANHCRFGHSIGVMHLAGKIAKRFEVEGRLNAEQVDDIRLAALLHDIGHGPFSHVSEDLLETYYDRGAVNLGSDKESIHERVTVDIIRFSDELQSILGPDRTSRVIDIIQGKEPHWFGKDIVSGPLDADKLDYILRDCRFAGVHYGIFDVSKIVDSLVILDDSSQMNGNRSYLGLSHEGVYAVEQMILAKHHMNAQVYRHKIRAISDAMLIRGLELAADEGIGWVKDLYSYDGTKDFADNYLRYYDDRVMFELAENGKTKSKEMFTRLMDRRLLKCVYNKRLNEINDAMKRGRFAKLNRVDRTNFEKAIAETLGVDPSFVLFNKLSLANPTYRAPGFALNAEEIYVLQRNKQPERLKDITWSIFHLRPDNQNEEEIQVYIPQDQITDMCSDDKEKAYETLEGKVESILLA